MRVWEGARAGPAAGQPDRRRGDPIGRSERRHRRRRDRLTNRGPEPRRGARRDLGARRRGPVQPALHPAARARGGHRHVDRGARVLPAPPRDAPRRPARAVGRAGGRAATPSSTTRRRPRATRTRRSTSRACSSPTRSSENRLDDVRARAARSPARSRAPTPQRGVWKAPAGTDADAARRARADRHADRRGERPAQPARRQRLRTFPVFGTWSGVRARSRRRPARRRSGSTCRCAGSRCSSRRASTAARSGRCSSPTTSRCGRRSGSTSARSCRTCSARAPSRAHRRARRTSSSATRETTTQNDIDLGIVNILVGFAPLKPAEFVIIQIQQLAGQIQT